MLPEHRLAVLLQQFKDQQAESCIWHTSSASPSLYSDHTCDRSRFPTEAIIEFMEPSMEPDGEVWQVRFSHNGRYLAGCGSGDKVFIWDMETFSLAFSLADLKGGVGNIAWSPDDTMLVTCGRDGYARIWDMNVSQARQASQRQYF